MVDRGEGAEGLIWLSSRPDGLEQAVDDNPTVRWVQLPMAGIEGIVESGVLAGPRAAQVTWTCAKGTFAQPVAEHALTLALAGLRQVPRRARATTWAPPMGETLFDASVTVLGGGGITVELAKLLAPFRARITVVRRHPGAMDGVESTVGPSELHAALTSALVVFVALALVPETVGIISAPELAVMGQNAWLVNVGRGRHVATDDLVHALREGTIGGAALDVTDPEPLPDGHPLWALPNCLITPHSANTPQMAEPLLAGRITDNVRRLALGLPLQGMVDPVAGY